MAALASPPLPLDPTTGSVFSDKDQGSEVSGPRIVLSCFFFFLTHFRKEKIVFCLFRSPKETVVHPEKKKVSTQ